MPVSGVGSLANVPSKSTSYTTNTTLSMDNFMQLLITQLQNQDVSSPMENSEMMAQMTQMATVQAMNTFTDLATTQYCATLMGQQAKVLTIENGGNAYKEGKIVAVDLVNQKVYLEGSDVAYGLGNVMSLGSIPESEKGDGEGEDGESSGTDNNGSTDKGTEESSTTTSAKSGNAAAAYSTNSSSAAEKMLYSETTVTDRINLAEAVYNNKKAISTPSSYFEKKATQADNTVSAFGTSSYTAKGPGAAIKSTGEKGPGYLL